MFLQHISQSELDRAVETLVHNGQLPIAQAVIAPCGYPSEVLQQTETLLDQWRGGLNLAQALLMAQKQTTQDEKEVRRAAGKEVDRFKRTIRAVFDDDELVLRLLGMRPRRRNSTSGLNESVAAPETNGAEVNVVEQPVVTATSRPSSNATDTLVAWRRTMTGAASLSEAQKASLMEAKWPAERIAETVALIDGWALADDRQKDAKRAYRAHMAANKATEQALRKWLKKAWRLIRVSTDEADASGEQQLKLLLGL